MTARIAEAAIDPLFLDRWSPRAFDASDMPVADLRTILEAVRWAPSAFNAQPWRLLYARRGDPYWPVFLDLLVPGNATWARHASALLFILSDTLTDRHGTTTPAYSHSFDAGAAWAQLGLQASLLGYHAHGMIGLDFERAREVLAIPDRFRIEAAVALGRRADRATLEEALRKREVPSDRRPLGRNRDQRRLPRLTFPRQPDQPRPSIAAFSSSYSSSAFTGFDRKRRAPISRARVRIASSS